MALERGRPASSPDRAAQAWRREAVEGRTRIAELVGQLADTVAEREHLMQELERTRLELSRLEARFQELLLEHQIIVGMIRATEARKAANNG